MLEKLSYAVRSRLQKATVVQILAIVEWRTGIMIHFRSCLWVAAAGELAAALAVFAERRCIGGAANSTLPLVLTVMELILCGGAAVADHWKCVLSHNQQISAHISV